MTLRAAWWLALSLAFAAVPAYAQEAGNGEPVEAEDGEESGAIAEGAEAVVGEGEEGPEAEEAQTEGAEAEQEVEEEQQAELEGEEGDANAAQAAAQSGADATQADGVVTIFHGDDDPPNTSRLVIPPVLLETRGDVRTTAVFPFYFERSAPQDFQLVAGPYYHRRGAQGDADVVFPLVWSYRFTDGSTTIVPPVYYRTRPQGFDFGLAPLVFTGRNNDIRYTVIPPLLTFAWADEDDAYTFSALFWRVRHHESVDWGIFPFVWDRTRAESSYTVAPPFYFRFAERDTETIVVPPALFYHRRTADGVSWGIPPLLFHSHDSHSRSWTLAPLFHYDSDDDGSMRFFSLLGGYARTPDSNTLVTPFYQRHRGKTELDAAFPLFMSLRDPRDRSSLTMITPLGWHAEDPASSTTVAFPFFAQIHAEGRYDTFLSLLYWDMQRYETRSRTSIFFPIAWRFRNGEDVSQLVLNTYYQERVRQGVRSWEFHFFPVFAFGESAPNVHWWTVFYGLAEYRSAGATGRGKAFWVPFDVR